MRLVYLVLMDTMTYPTLFNEKRAAQAAAFLLYHAGGRLPLLKLMKLMYLAERESLRLFGDPITGDKLYSMPHGPVLSMTYSLMNGDVSSVEGGWETWMEDRSGHDIALRDPSMIRTPELDLLELSDGDLEILAAVWKQFGHLEKYELRDFTHQGGCPEWEDPRGGSKIIPMGRLFKEFGYSQEGVQSAIQHLKEQAQLKQALG